MKTVVSQPDALYLFVRRDFVATYKQTVFGPLWYLIQPLLLHFSESMAGAGIEPGGEAPTRKGESR